MQINIVEPYYGGKSFNCPKCQAFAHQTWYRIERNSNLELTLYEGLLYPDEYENEFGYHINGFSFNNNGVISFCAKCEEIALWKNGELVYPNTCIAPQPNQDMPKDVQKIYNEAREVSRLSSRASTALLRLALEKLLPQIGAKKDTIDKMIGELVGKGLPKEIEKALDSLRVIGNEAVHPGTIDLDDNPSVSHALFKIMNLVVDRMITQQKEIDEVYSLIPESKLEGIEKRNKKVLRS